MVLRFQFVTSVVLAIVAVAARAQERDILEAAMERTQTVVKYQAPVRFGDSSLEAAELSLHDVLPRPWTVSRLLPLFEAAAARAAEPLQASIEPGARVQNEWVALVDHLSAILAASRDPRAALALDRVIAGPDFMVKCRLAENFLKYFSTEPGYQRPPFINTADAAPRAVNMCTIWADASQKWWNLNRQEVERLAATLIASSPPCASCVEDARTAIEQIRIRLHATAPTIHLTMDGDNVLRMVQITHQISIAGQSGTVSMGMQNDSPAADIRVKVPAQLLGRNDLMIAGLVISTGFKTVVIDSTRVNNERVIPVRLAPVSSKTFTGTVTFQNGAPPKPFTVWANLRITKANVSPDIHSGGSVLQRVAEGIVDENGRFSITLPDITSDPILNSPGNWFELAAQPNSWVMQPNTIPIDRMADADLKLTATPRGRQ